MEPEEIKRIREKLGLSQSGLAEVFGDSGPKIISNIETGFRKPGNTKILMLRLLDSLSRKEALGLIKKLKEQNRLYREQA
jgi:DNA-binding transcriptional regulator YiaG